MAVHRELGCGFLEAVSREVFTIELQERGIPFVREARLPVRYRQHVLPLSYTVDFICYDEILVELKALQAIGPIEMAQRINYLRIARRSRGLLLEFRRYESAALSDSSSISSTILCVDQKACDVLPAQTPTCRSGSTDS